MADGLIKVEGIRELNKALKGMDSNLPKKVRLALNEAVDVVIDDALPNIPRRSGKARGSVRAQSTRTLARAAAGGRKAPYYAWLDFGGRVGRNNSVERPFRKRGRYLYQSYFKLRDSGEFTRAMEKVLVELAQSAGMDAK